MAPHFREGLRLLWRWWFAQTLGPYPPQAQHFKPSSPWFIDPESWLQQIRAADRDLIDWQNNQTLGLEKSDQTTCYSYSSPVSSKEGEIFPTSWLAARLLRLRHERALLRPPRPAVTLEIQRSPAHRIHPWFGFQHVRWEASCHCRMGRPFTSLVMGSSSAISKLII
jgi:hypothetical protein